MLLGHTLMAELIPALGSPSPRSVFSPRAGLCIGVWTDFTAGLTPCRQCWLLRRLRQEGELEARPQGSKKGEDTDSHWHDQLGAWHCAIVGLVMGTKASLWFVF